MDDKKINDFLARIGQIESSGGKNTNHAVINHGIQKGDSAYGTYGLMPNTIDEIATKSADPAVSSLVDMDSDEKKQYLKAHPEIETTLAKTLANKVLMNQGGDEEKAAYAWNQGHNLTPDKIDARDYKNSDYVQKYDNLTSRVSNSPSKTTLNMQGSPEGSKLMAYLTGSAHTTPDNRIPAAATALGSGSIAGLGGMGGTRDTLALNADQKSDMDEALSAMARSPASTVTAYKNSPYSNLAVKKPAEIDTTVPEVSQPRLQQAPAAPAEMPQFNLINQLIADYQNKGKK